MLYQVHLVWAGFKLTTLVAIGSDCMDNCKFNYHIITTMTTLLFLHNCILYLKHLSL
jgi:hypothetical protein